MKFISALSMAFLAAAPAYSQIAHPNPLLSRAPWPEGLLLRGPGAQIGASFRDLTPAEARQAAAEQNWLFFDRLGVVVYEVRADSPASRAGLVKGDRITVFDGHRVRNANEFSRLVDETPPGWTVEVTVIRDGKVRVLSITPTL